jgi:hypothetical protein
VDDDPSEVDWLEIEDDSEQSSRLAGKKPVAAPMNKRGQTSASKKPREAIDPKEAEDPASKRRCVIADWPKDEDEEVEEVSGIIASSRRE